MASNQRIAQPYVDALFAVSVEQACEEQVHGELSSLGEVCVGSRPFLLFLRSPVITPRRKAELMETLCKGVSALTLQFLQLLCRKGRASLLPLVASGFTARYWAHQGILPVQLRIAHEISSETLGVFEQQIASLIAERPRIALEVDPALIGGFVLQIGERQLDKSVRTALRSAGKKLRFSH